MGFGSNFMSLDYNINPSVDQSISPLLNNFDASAVSEGNGTLAMYTSGNGYGSDAIGGFGGAVLAWGGDIIYSVLSCTMSTDGGGEIGITSSHFAYQLESGGPTLDFTIAGKRDGAIVGTLELTAPFPDTDITLDFTSFLL